jgi:uncharacterized protein
MFQIIIDLKEKMKELFKNENTGHDFTHLSRVLDHAIAIQEKEGGDPYVVAVSALIHDLHRLMFFKQKRYVSPEDSLDLAKQILLECDVDLTKLDAILDVVKNHDNKDNKNFSLETLIIQDADSLDAIGEIGLLRTLTYCKTHQIPLTADEPLDATDYMPDIHPISTCHYIYRTMIPNAKNLYTNTAKELAKDRIQLLEDFLEKHYKKR